MLLVREAVGEREIAQRFSGIARRVAADALRELQPNLVFDGVLRVASILVGADVLRDFREVRAVGVRQGEAVFFRRNSR
jgi:hypothetical protein